MALMSSSPGVLYNVEGVFRNGSDKGKILPGFNLDSKKPLAGNLKSTTAAIYSPKLPRKVDVLLGLGCFVCHGIQCNFFAWFLAQAMFCYRRYKRGGIAIRLCRRHVSNEGVSTVQKRSCSHFMCVLPVSILSIAR